MKKRILSSLLAASMMMTATPLTAQALNATDDVGESPAEIATVESTGSISEPSAQLPAIESVPAVEIEEIAETREASDGVVEVSDDQSLQDAVAGAPDGVETVIRLENDIALSKSMQVEENQIIILDLNEHTITAAEGFSTRIFTNYGDLTIQGNGTVDVTAAGAAGYGTVNNYGTLTVVDGTYKNMKESDASNFFNRNGGTATFIEPTIYGGGGCVATEVNTTTTIKGGYYEDSTYPAIENRGDMTITGGTFKNTSCSSCDGRWGYTVRSGEKSENAYLKIQGETEDSVKVTGVQGGLAVIGGTADIYNGSYETAPCKIHGGDKAFYAGYFTGESYKTATTIYGGTFESCSKNAVQVGNGNPAPDSGAGEESTVMIKDGTFIGGDAANTAIIVEDMENAIGAANITGGSFSSDVKDFIDPSSDLKPNENGQWVATPIPESEGVAAIGDKYYRTLEDAVRAVSEGGTITILRDVDEAPGISVPSGKNFTLDFAGHTYTLSNPGAGSTGTETNGFQLLKDSDIVFKNGTIRISDKNGSAGSGKPIGRIIQNYANLTLEDMQFYAKNQAGGENYALSFNCGNIVFKGDTSIYVTDPENTIVFDICKYSSYPSAAVVFDESYTGTIQGTIVYDSPDPTTHTLKIKGNGTFGKIEATDASTEAAKNAITVYSGHYAEPVNPDYLDESLNTELKRASNTEAPYSYYHTVNEAIQAAEPGDTITVIKDDTVTQSYTVSFDGNNGNAIVSVTVPEKTEIILPVPTREGYEFEGWYNGDKLVKTPYTVTANVTLTARWDKISSGGGAHHPEAGGSSSTSDRYDITKPSNVENGSIKVSDTKAEKGDTVTITVTPDEGYELDKLAVYDKDGDKIDLKDKGDGKYTFEMPKGDVEIKVSFAAIEDETPKANFTDVAADAWYADAVQYVYENGLMSGTSETTFSPDLTTTRGMIVTILYRMENEPTVTSTTAFTDVASDQYYANAVAWAAQNGIVSGTTATTFAPNAAITREQMAAILYRYAQFKGYDVSVKADLSVYTDAAQIGSYATDAMAWANGAQLITGTSATTLTPAGNATRAQVAAILMRFCENVAK
mgnify:CR=1 FL=1